MQLTHAVRHDASVDEVRAMLLDPACREQANQAQSLASTDVTVPGDSVTIDIVRPGDDVSSLAGGGR